jgi:hypothetical protein
MGPDKRALIVASSLAAIPLATVLVAATIYRRRPKSLQKSTFLGQDTRSKTSVITATHKQQQREKSQAELHSPRHGSEAGATTTITTTAAISTNTVVADKDITPPGVAPSPMVGSITSDSQTIVPSSQTQKEEDISVSDEAKKAGESLKELVVTAIKEAKDSATGTGKQLKEQTIDIAPTADSKDIRSLGDDVNALVSLFEETMIEIRKERYNEQIKLLDSYKDLLQTHIKVAAARRRMARKLKPGA